MSKLFYTDPLKAAMMTRDHGVKLIGVYPDGTEEGIKLINIVLDIDRQSGMDVAVRYLVHPNSYHIFEPVEGDVVWEHWEEVTGYPQMNHYFRVGFIDKDGNLIDDEDELISKWDSIIQRNNTAFFMAEVEADE